MSLTKKRLKYFATVVLVIGFIQSSVLRAQNSDLGNWLIYIGSKQINTKWNLHHEIQYRNYDALSDLEQLLLRTGIGYSFNEGQNNLLMGYGFIHSQNHKENINNKTIVDEHRIFQQFIAKQNVGLFKIQHRYRFEQRFVESDFKLRFRYFLGATMPLSKAENNKFYLSAYNEIFLNSKSSIFDRNRLYGGFGYSLNKNIRFELGYMNQSFETNSRDQVNIISFVTF